MVYVLVRRSSGARLFLAFPGRLMSGVGVTEALLFSG